jgi:uncharacterized protein
VTILSYLVGRALKLPPRRSADIHVEKDIAVPMRDGVTLLADRWFAQDLGAQPVVLMRSPYGQMGLFAVFARLFAERGFQFVLQRCRGTGGSGGTLDPMRQERADGLDTLAWIQRQSWFTKGLFTFGSSYLGFTQWAMAGEAGNRIDAMALHVTLSNFRNETLAFGGFTQDGSLQWTAMMKSMEVPHSRWQQMAGMLSTARHLRRVQDCLPLRELDQQAVGTQVSWWQDWVGHGEPTDPWWEQVDHSAAVSKINAPAAMIGGWRDIFLPWQVRDFEAMQAAGREAWLTIGPWAHASIGGFAETIRQALALFLAHDKGSRPFADRNRVRLYVMGAEEWREYASWPPPGTQQKCLYLESELKLSSSAPSRAADPTKFVYDPREPTPALHGPRLMGAAKKPNMVGLERRRDTISFTSASLSSVLEAIGPVKVELYIRSDRAHTDFYVCLCDVDAAGRALHVVDGYLRLRPGNPAEDGDGVRHLTIECWPTAYRFARSHRLRLIVASGAHPRYARNLGTGEPLGSGTHMVAAHQEIFHDPARPSALTLTLWPPQDALPT